MNLAPALLAALPDIPRWVELRSALLAGTAVVHGPIDHCVVRGTGWSENLFVLGEPPLHLIQEAARLAPGAELLAPPESQPYLAAALGRPGVRARLLTPRENRLPADPRETRLLFSADSHLLEHVPEPLRGELLLALWHVPLSAAFVEGQPVSFCYPGSITETLWDVSIDTLEPFRRRGLAARAVAAMVQHLRAVGKAPVWGAADDNPPSLALAQKLGFAVVDSIYVFPPLEEP